MTIRAQFNGVTAILLVMIAALAATAVHYAHALDGEQTKARTESDANAHAVAQPAATPESSPAALIPWTTSNTWQEAPSSGSGHRDAGTVAVARDRLSRLQDPQGRAQRLAQLTDDARRSLAELVPVLGLSWGERDHIVEVATEAALQGEQRVLECKIDPDCDLRSLDKLINADVQEQALQFLGPEKKARLQAYLESAEERGAAEQLRKRLPENSFTDETAARLAAALSEERLRFVQDSQRPGERIETNNSGATGVSVLSFATPGSTDEPARRQASATLYTERLIARVSTVLDGEALKIFSNSQEMALESYKRRLREQEVVNAARRATGKPAKSLGD